MKRELAEELVLKIKVLKEIENWLEYELPSNLLGGYGKVNLEVKVKNGL